MDMEVISLAWQKCHNQREIIMAMAIHAKILRGTALEGQANGRVKKNRNVNQLISPNVIQSLVKKWPQGGRSQSSAYP